MNRTFKVASNKLRGTVVCSEKASSYQGRSVKTVIAAAVASLVAGTAFAADAPAEDPLFWQDKVITQDFTLEDGQTLTIHSAVLQKGTITIKGGDVTYDSKPAVGVGDFTLAGGALDVKDGKAFTVKDFTMTGGKIIAQGSKPSESYNEFGRTYPTVGGYNSFTMEGGDVELKNGGRIWVGTSYSKDADSFGRMELKGGTIAMQGDAFITGDKLLIKTGTWESDKGGEKHPVTYGEDTLGFNTVGFDGATVTVEGTGNVLNAVASELTAGSIEVAKEGELSIVATTSTNQGSDDPRYAHLADRKTAQDAIDAVSRFEVKGGTFTNNGRVSSEVKDYVVSEGTVVNNGQMSVKNLVVKGGEFSTIYMQPDEKKPDQAYFTWESISLEGGALNLAAANSRTDNVKIDESHPGNRLLMNYGKWKLAGGDLQVAGESWTGAVKVGTASSATILDVEADGYAFDKVEFGSAKTDATSVNALNVMNGATLTVGTLDFTHGSTNIVNGTLEVEKLVWDNSTLTGPKKDGELSIAAAGELVTTGDQLFVKGEGEAAKWGLTTAATHITSESASTLTITDTFSATAEDIKNANKLFGQDGKNAVSINFVNVTLTGDDADSDKVTFDQTLGLAGINSAVTAPESKDGSAALTIDAGKSVGVGTLIVDENTKSLTVAPSENNQGAGALVIGGTAEGGNVVSGVEKLDSLTTADLKLGKDAASKGTLNADKVVVNGNFDAVGAWNLTDLAITGEANAVAAGSGLTVQKLASTGETASILSVAGTLAANRVEATVALDKDSTFIIGERLTAEAEEEEAPAAKLFRAALFSAQPAAASETDVQEQIASLVTTEDKTGIVIGTNKDAKALLAARAGDAFNAEKNVGLYVDSTIGVDSDKGTLVVGTYAEDHRTTPGTVTLGNNSVTVIDLPSFAEGEPVFTADDVNVQKDAVILLNGTDDLSTTVFVEGGKVSGTTSGKLVTTNKFLKADFEAEKDKLDNLVGTNLVVSYNDDAVDAPVGKVVKGLYENGTSAENKAVLTAVGNSAYFNEDGKLSAEGTQALNEYVTLPVAAGLYNAAYDAQNAFTGVIQERAFEPGLNYGVWANAYYAQNEAKTLYGASGYEADVYGGVLGADATFAQGYRLGAAFTFGQVDTDSKGTVNKYSTDSDFWGVSLYAGADISRVSVAADVSYLALGNDISGSIAGVKADESVDGTVLTVGLRADATVWSTENFSVIPHAGLRYAQIDVDDYRGFESDKLNAVELPVGVALKGSFETSGLSLKPYADLTLAPQIGDKEVETVIGETDVLGNVYTAKLGLEAAKGGFTFGISYSYGWGSDDRSNNVFNLKAGYNF